MSATTTTPIPPIGAPNTAGQPTTKTDQVLAFGRDLPDMLGKAEVLDPATAAKWTGKALLASKTFWGSIGVIVLSAIVKRYSLGWDQNFIDTVVGLADLAALAALRKVSSLPITGIFTKATVAQVVATAP